jgi:ABC-type nickel/cobalt efflux system permease component RcnA
MTKHDHDHHHHQHGHEHHHAPKAAWHKNWITWVVVGLMLAAMAVYVLSFDESLGPESNPEHIEEPAAM